MEFYSEKIIKLKTADIHLHYANNAGRGSNNVTVTIVKSNVERKARTKQYASNEIVERFQLAGFSGVVKIPNYVVNRYGGLKK